MTRDQDIERVLDRWFTEGPTQMPDRFLADTLDRIDRAPQRRLADLRTRLPAMHPMLRFAAAAAVVLAVAGLGAAALIADGRRRRSAVALDPVSLPASLQAEWRPVGTRQHPLLSAHGQSTSMDIVIGPTTITIFE